SRASSPRWSPATAPPPTCHAPAPRRGPREVRSEPHTEAPMRRFLIVVALAWLAGSGSAAAAPEGTLTIAMHFTPVTRWLDPAEGESTITPYLLLYALHDGLLKPMPGVGSGPSLAESWSMAKDALSAEFTLRAARFHNGDPVTAADVKFSFEPYRGGGAKVLKETVKEIQTPAPNRVRFVFKEPWPDFAAFYGTFVTSASWVVPRRYVERVGEDGFRKAPIGAGPYKFVSLNPGVELVLEAFDSYWRKPPSIKRLVFRSLPDETTRAAARGRGRPSERLRRRGADAVSALQLHGRDDPGLAAGRRHPHAIARDGARHVHDGVARQEAARRGADDQRRLRQRGHAAGVIRHEERRLRVRGLARGRRPLPTSGARAGPKEARGAAAPDPEDPARAGHA